MADDLAIVIPVAGIGRGMRSYGAKSLIELKDGRTVIRRQIDVCRSIFPRADIVVVVGHEAERVIRSLPPGIRIVENEKYEDTGVARSILMGLRAIDCRRALVVYGDLVFNREIFVGLPKQHSAVTLDTEGALSADNVGVNLDRKMAVHFDFGPPIKWAQIVQLAPIELQLFKTIASHPDARRMLGWEILNKVVDRGGQFRIHEPKDCQLVEIDTPKDIARAWAIQ